MKRKKQKNPKKIRQEKKKNKNNFVQRSENLELLYIYICNGVLKSVIRYLLKSFSASSAAIMAAPFFSTPIQPFVYQVSFHLSTEMLN